MKKAKILLAAIAVFAIVGGAYAFKAHRAGSFIYLRALGTTSCTLSVQSFSISPQFLGQPPVTLTSTYVTNLPGACTLSTLYYTAP
jgi:hypothetical protein